MAIAFDALTAHAGATATSITFSHTVASSNPVLFVCVTDSSSNLVTGVTYNGTAMTLVGTSSAPSDRYIHTYCLAAPSTGANNVVVTASASNSMRPFAVSYTGAHQSVQADVSDTNTTTTNTNSYSRTLTTLEDNCWTMIFIKNNAAVPAAGSGTTQRDASTWATFIGDSNSATSPAGSSTLAATTTNASGWGSVMTTIVPDTYSESSSFIPQIIMS